VDIANTMPNIFGQDGKYNKRIYLLYDGIHYDVIARNISSDMEESFDKVVFDPKDKYAYDGAMVLAKELNAKREFTDLDHFSIQCGVCYQKFTGENQAIEHNKKTGHSNFQEVKK
jgi:ubiquitin thioesterase OTU1